MALNVIGPHWDGNQVWFVLGGGAIFAAWPLVYATAFSGFYIVMLVLLWSMILRPLGFEYRSKLPSPAWRSVWDTALFVSGLVPMVVFGAAIGNVLQGVPFHFDWRLTSFYTGSFLSLFNPFAILCGLMSLALAIYMGGSCLANGAEDPIGARARRAAIAGGLAALVIFTVAGFWVSTMEGFRLVAGPDPGVPQTPLHQQVTRAPGALLANYGKHPALWALPALVYAGLLLGVLVHVIRRPILGLVAGSAGVDRRDRHGRRRHVPLHHAVVQQPFAQPHGLELRFEQGDADLDGGLCRDLHTAHRLVHELGLLGDARQGRREARRDLGSRLLEGGRTCSCATSSP